MWVELQGILYNLNYVVAVTLNRHKDYPKVKDNIQLVFHDGSDEKIEFDYGKYAERAYIDIQQAIGKINGRQWQTKK